MKILWNILKQVDSDELHYLQSVELTLQNTDLEMGDEFWEAVSVFVDSQKASVSLLQKA